MKYKVGDLLGVKDPAIGEENLFYVIIGKTTRWGDHYYRLFRTPSNETMDLSEHYVEKYYEKLEEDPISGW